MLFLTSGVPAAGAEEPEAVEEIPETIAEVPETSEEAPESVEGALTETEDLPETTETEETPAAIEEVPEVSEEAPEAVEEAPEKIVEEGETGSEETITTVVEEEPEPEPNLLPLWIGLGVIAGILIGAVGAILLRKLRKKKSKTEAAADKKSAEAYPATLEIAAEPVSEIRISKLHEQGARSSQQDSFAASPKELLPSKGVLAVVCDGMGGLQDGDKVSQAAVSAMLNGFLELQGDPSRVLLALLAKANRAVNYLLGPAGQRRSGTTMVAGILKDSKFSYLSVGDSRICLYRAGQLIQLNREHVYGNDLVTDAVNDLTGFREVWTNPQQGALTSFLGMGELKYIDIPAQPVQVLAGDKLILMSDGVYNALTPEEMTAALALPSGEDTEALRAAIDAKHYEHQDNYTAVVLTVPAA